MLREALLQLEARAPPNPNQLEERPGLRETIAARCRRGSQAGGSSQGQGSGQHENLAAVALAAPCKSQVWFGWCGALQRPHWTPDQEQRQLLFAREQSWPLRTGQAEAWQRWQQGLHQQQQQQQLQQQQQQQQWVPGPWQWLAAWRRRRRLHREGTTGGADAQSTGPLQRPPRRRAWWSWRPPRREATQGLRGDAAPQGAPAPAWQHAPGLMSAAAARQQPAL